MRPRLAVFFSHPTQHHAPLWREITRRNDIELRVFYYTNFGTSRESLDRHFGVTFAWDVDLLAGYDHEFLCQSSGVPPSPGPTLRAPGLASALDEFRPHVAYVQGWGSLASINAIRQCTRRRIPIITQTDANIKGATGITWLSRVTLGRWAAARFSGFLVCSSSNEAVYRRLFHVPKQRLRAAPFPFDADRFGSGPASPTAAREQLAYMGVDPSVLTVTWAGKLRPLKRPLDMIQAFCQVNLVTPLQLLMVGSGELASEVRSAIPEQWKHRCVLPGFVNQSLMPAVFAAGEIYAMTSDQEPLGMSVVEAMAMGAACVVSDACGVVGNDELLDTLIPGATGLAFSAGDVNDLASKLASLALDPCLRRRISEAGRARVLARTARTTADRVAELVFELAEDQKPS